MCQLPHEPAASLYALSYQWCAYHCHPTVGRDKMAAQYDFLYQQISCCLLFLYTHDFARLVDAAAGDADEVDAARDGISAGVGAIPAVVMLAARDAAVL